MKRYLLVSPARSKATNSHKKKKEISFSVLLMKVRLTPKISICCSAFVRSLRCAPSSVVRVWGVEKEESEIKRNSPHVDICWSHQTTKRFSLSSCVDFAISDNKRMKNKKKRSSDTREEDSSALKILFTCSTSSLFQHCCAVLAMGKTEKWDVSQLTQKNWRVFALVLAVLCWNANFCGTKWTLSLSRRSNKKLK